MFQTGQGSYPNFSTFSPNPTPMPIPTATATPSAIPNPTPTPTPTPTPNLPFSAVTSEPALHPTGTDQHATPSLYPYIHGGFQIQPQFHQEPNASHNAVITQADQIGYAPAINTLSETPMLAASLNSLWNNLWMNQHLSNDVMMKTRRPSKVFQSVRCEICKIDCNTKYVFEKHILGKKHKRQMQIVSTATITNTSGGIIQNESLEQTISGASGVTVGGELGTKKQIPLEGGAPTDSVMFCTICNVPCNSQVVFSKHLTGRKHTAQAAKLLSGAGTTVAANSDAIALTGPTVEPCANGTKRNGTKKKGSKKSKIVQSVWCEVCKVSCDTNVVLSIHKVGKKHLKNLQKSNITIGTSTSAEPATTPIIGPVENPEATKHKSKKKVKRSQASEEDLETKRRKIMESGTAEGEVRACTVCNVVCNSPTVFNSHLGGRKHIAMVKKVAEASSTTSEPQTVNAA